MRRLGLLLLSLLPTGMLLPTLSGQRRFAFFLLLRWVVTGCAALLALVAHDKDLAAWTWIMIGLLVLFNPFVSLHLRRDTWRLLDLLAAGILVAAAFNLQPSSQSGRRGMRHERDPRRWAPQCCLAAV